MDIKKLNTQQAYNAIAEIYNSDFGKDREFFDIFLDPAINDIVNKNISGEIIDLGSGPGNVVDYLLEKELENRIIAVDFAEKFCHLLQTKYSNVPQVKVVNDDMVRFMTNHTISNTIALVIANYSFIHVPDNEFDGLLRNIYLSLVRGGYLVFAVWGGKHKGMEPEPYQVQQDQRLKVDIKLESYMNNFSEAELKERLKSSGFDISVIKSFKTPPLPGEFNQPKIVAYSRK